MDVERRVTVSETTVEERCECQKTGEKKPVIVGYAAVFNSESRNLGGFVETIHPRAFDDVLAGNPDVIGVFNHDRNKLLARTSNGSLKLKPDEYGLRYEITPPNTQEARDVVELVRGGYVVGSSFAFACKKDGGDAWSSSPNGVRKREIRSIDLLEDVGPVVRPAYNASSVVVSRRALEMAVGEAFRVNQTMANAAKRGLKQASKVENADQMLVIVSERVANREILTVEEVAYLESVHRRCAELRSPSWHGSPAWVEWQLAGGDAGAKWIARRVEAREVPAAENLPLAPVDLEWDAAAAADRVFKYAGGDWSKYAQAFFYVDPQKREQADGYKLGFADVIDGKLAAVPAAVMDVSDAVDGDSGIPPADVDEIKKRVDEYQSAIEKAIAGEEEVSGRSDSSDTEARDEEMEDLPSDEPSAGSLSANNYALYEALEIITEDEGKWPQDGPAGAHYMRKSMFSDMGMMCQNCVFFNSEGTCDAVEGAIDPEGICKLWIIPEEKLSIETTLESVGKDDSAPEPAAQPPAAAAPQSQRNDAITAVARLKAAELGRAANAKRG
jgi:uncharacterized protein